MPGVLFWILLPFHFLMNTLTVILSIFRNQGKITSKAKVDALADLSELLRKRKQIQKSCKVSIFHLLQVLDWNPISPFKKLFLG
jgi:hypothetical protein